MIEAVDSEGFRQETRVLRLVNHTHATANNPLDNAIVRDEVWSSKQRRSGQIGYMGDFGQQSSYVSRRRSWSSKCPFLNAL